MSSHNNFASTLWDFIVERYNKPDVKRLVLQLQDKYDANVNIILWCCWLEEESIDISAAWLDQVLIDVDSVSQLTVANLRRARRAIVGSDLFDDIQSQKLKKHILQAELCVEKLLVEKLALLTEAFIKDNESIKSESTCYLDVSYYLDFLQVPNVERCRQVLLGRVF